MVSDVDRYIETFPEDIQLRLTAVRHAIKKAVPMSEEIISYKMPAYKKGGILVYFAGYKNHIGFYPTASGIANFSKEISVYKHARGSVQFPHDAPLPLSLISKITRFKALENRNKIEKNKKK